MNRRLLLDVVVGHCALILELLARKDKPLLIYRNALLLSNLFLHHGNRVTRLDLECDRLARQSLDEDLHSSYYEQLVFM